NPTANPTFATAVQFAAGNNPVGVKVVDLNGDGINDVLVANDVAAGSMTVLKNTTTQVQPQPGLDTIQFGTPISYAVGNNPAGPALADVNGDAVLDAVLPNSNSDTISTLSGIADSTFRTVTDESFLGAVYVDVLGRAIDPGGQSSFMNVLSSDDQIRLV